MNGVNQRVRTTTIAIIALLALLLTVATSVAAPSTAEAQAGETVFSGDFRPLGGGACIPGTSPIGTITTGGVLNGDYCRIDGFAPISTLADCVAASNFFNIPNGYGFSASTGACGFNGFAQDLATPCPPPTIGVNDLRTSIADAPVIFEGCVLPITSGVLPDILLPPIIPNSFFGQLSATAACIDSDAVQGDPAAKGLGLGQTFVSKDGNRLSITTGGPTCTFDGSSCDKSLNLYQVDDVAKCIASKATATAAPVAAAAAPAPVAIAVNPPSELAHTGTGVVTSVFGILGAALLGAGALVGGGLRRPKDDD